MTHILKDAEGREYKVLGRGINDDLIVRPLNPEAKKQWRLRLDGYGSNSDAGDLYCELFSLTEPQVTALKEAIEALLELCFTKSSFAHFENMNGEEEDRIIKVINEARRLIKGESDD